MLSTVYQIVVDLMLCLSIQRLSSVHTEEMVNAENLAHVESPVVMREDVASVSAVAVKEITSE
jgi:hypothetical protein